MTQVIVLAAASGIPVPKGGGIKLVDGLATIVREAGGELRTDAEVERILVADGRATAVRLVGGETIPAARAVLACVTPTQLYGRLLGEGDVPARVGEAAGRFRYGRGEMQIHVAMNEPPRWRGDDRLGPACPCSISRLASTASRAPSTRPSAGCPGRGDDRARPARGARPLTSPGRLLDPLGSAPGAAAAAQG